MFLLAAAAPLNCAKSDAKADKKGAAAAEKSSASEKGKDSDKKQPADPAAELNVLRLGMKAPDFNLQDVDGKTLTLADFKGRAVVLVFWAIACPKEYCIDQTKELEDFVEKQKLDVAILPVTSNDSRDKNKEAAELLKKNGISARAMFDVGNEAGRAYQLRAFPLFALIDRAGRLDAAGPMFIKQKFQTMNFLEMVAAAAKGKEVPKCEFAHFKNTEDYKKMVGTEAKNFKLLDLDGMEQSPLFYRGFTRLLIVFWATTCPHCKSELPRIEYYYRTKAPEHNMKTIALAGMPDSSDKEAGRYLTLTKQIALQLKLTFPVVPDYGSKIQNMYGIKGVPSMVLVDVDGKIMHTWHGESDFFTEDISCVLDRLSGGKDR